MRDRAMAASMWRSPRVTALSLLLASCRVFAQTSQFSSAASSTTASAFTHTIAVAQGGFTFVPDVVQAEVGDYVEYDFYPTNHSVVRAEYLYPCIPYEDTGVDKIGFFSGFKPVDAILANPPTFTIRINDTLPIFYYCSAPGSCITHGMVGVINPNASVSLAFQRQLAENSSFMLEPGEPWPSEGTPDPFQTANSTGGGEATPTATSSHISSSSSAAASSTSAAAASTTSASASASKSHSGLSGGAIAGITIGAAAVALIAAALLYLCGRNSRRAPPTLPAGSIYDPHMSYVSSHPGNAGKHMTLMSNRESGAFGGHPGHLSGYSNAALPGYAPASSGTEHDGVTRPYYAPSDALSPASEAGRSPSPSQMMRGVGVPPYMSMPQHAVNDATPLTQPDVATAPNGPGGPHEMYAPTEDGGLMGFLHKASMRKSGGVERYE